MRALSARQNVLVAPTEDAIELSDAASVRTERCIEFLLVELAMNSTSLRPHTLVPHTLVA